MSVFKSFFPSDYVPVITTTAPMTVTLTAINIAKFVSLGGVCWVGFNLTLTVGGVAGAASIEVSLPIPTGFPSGAGLAFVANVTQGGVSNIGRARFNAAVPGVGIFKSNGINDVAWALGAGTNINAQGLYLL